MIVYDKFFKLIKKRGISQYDLYTYYDISKFTLDRLRHNKNMETYTLNHICKALQCDLSDIAEYIEEK